MLLIALLLSLWVGVSLGLLGGGGSILTLPILRYVLHMEGHSAIATSLLVVGATSLAGLYSHARRGRVQWRTGLVFGSAGMLGAYLSGRVAHFIPAALLLLGFGAMMFATALAMLRPERARRGVSPQSRRPPGRLPLPTVVLEGLVVGAVTGLVGAGGGFLVVPALVLLGRLPMETAIGTSLLVIALKSFAGFAGYIGHTPLDASLALSVVAAAVVGSFAGAALAPRLSARSLRHAFAWLVVAMAFFILAQEAPPVLGAEARPALSIMVSAAGTLLVLWTRRWLSRRAAQRRSSAAAATAPSPSTTPSAPTTRRSLGGHLERNVS
jgi:uncharacterized membrane protein YfcA